jgi:hypothetical protein
MSDRFPAQIDIGGPVPKALRSQLIQAMAAENAILDNWDGSRATAELLEQTIKDGQILSLYNAQASYGKFHELEAFLVEQSIHFDRRSEAYREYNAEAVFYRGCEEPLVLPADQNGGIMLYSDSVSEILDDPALDDPAKIAALRCLVAPPEAAELQPIRFI